MHDTAFEIGREFFSLYLSHPESRILDLGAMDVNGSLRDGAPKDATYIGADIEAGNGVDVVTEDPYALPFEDGSFDAVVSSSCFEHSQMFWLTFLEALRVAKPNGYIYINAPSNGVYHAYPFDNWRFYPDAPLALIAWAKHMSLEVSLVESFTARRKDDHWNDFVMVFCKCAEGRGDFPPKLLSDIFQTAFNIRTYKSNEISNLRAETEDMILMSESQAQLEVSRKRLEETEEQLEETCAHLKRESGKLAIAEAQLSTLRSELQAAVAERDKNITLRLQRSIRKFAHSQRDLSRHIRRKLRSYNITRALRHALGTSVRGERHSGEWTMPNVLFVSSDTASPSHVYRVENMAIGLRTKGCLVEIVGLHELYKIIDRVGDFDVVVFWRIAHGSPFAWSGDLDRIVRDCRDNRIATFFDVDDLVFDSDLCTPQFVDGIRYLSQEERIRYDEGVRGYHDMMKICGNAIVTTKQLASAAAKFGVRSFVVPNGLDSKYQAALSKPLAMPQHETVDIGYTPGTRTHQRDFAEAAAAISNVLEQHPDARLRVLGPLDLNEFPKLEKLIGSQVFLDTSVGRHKVFEFNQTIDINIVPLEQDNPFTAAKSELKYFEAAAFGVPTVASPVGPHQDCIENGHTGYLARTEREWVDALSAMVGNAELRRRIGLAAREHVAKTYSAQVVGTTLLEAFKTVRAQLGPAAVAEPATEKPERWIERNNYRGDRPLYINWLISGLLIGSGGHRMLLRAAYKLSTYGHRVRLYFTETSLQPEQIRGLLHKNFFPFDCPIYVYNGTMRPADVVFGTFWKTVPLALKHRDDCCSVFYFIQDFEPYFYAMGSEYIMAENTYRQGCYAITAGPWCAHFYRKWYNGEADYFTFPIEKVYSKRVRKKLNKNIVFFAKPEMPRRCYELGIGFLEQFHRQRPDVEIIMFGSGHVEPKDLPFPVTQKGVMTTEALAEMYANADLGIAFSPTNPSAVPYEMMACGLPVVDLDRPGAIENFGGRDDLVFLADPRPEQMAQQVSTLLDDSDELRMRAERGIEFVSSFPDEEAMGRRIEELIVNRVKLTSH